MITIIIEVIKVDRLGLTGDPWSLGECCILRSLLVSVCGVPNLKVMRSPHMQSSTMKKLQEHETGKLAKSRLVMIALSATNGVHN